MIAANTMAILANTTANTTANTMAAKNTIASSSKYCGKDYGKYYTVNAVHIANATSSQHAQSR